MYFPLAITIFLLPSLSISQSNETLLIQYLVEKQVPYARPTFKASSTIIVTFGLEMVHIVSIEEVSQTITIKVWQRMSWLNEVMSWSPEKWGNVKQTRIEPHLIWTPDLFLVEDVSEGISAGPLEHKTQVVMRNDGIHKWYIPALLYSSCRFDVKNFPFDHQFCTFKFMSWTYDQSELDIIADPADMVTNYYVNSSEWDLHGIERQIVSQKYNCCPEPFVHVEYTLELRRKPLYYIFNVITPCIIQMMIILCTFFLPPASGERIGVAITVLLVFAVYLEVLSSSLPKTSSSIPALSKFYLSAMAGSAFSIIATCFVLVIHFKGTEKGVGPIPCWVRSVFLKFLGGMLCVRLNRRNHTNKEILVMKKNNNFPIRSPDDDYLSVSDEGKALLGTGANCGEPMERLTEEVKIITALIHDQNLRDEIEEEWHTLGKVCDRIFFIMFCIYFLTCSLVIFIPVYIANHSA